MGLDIGGASVIKNAVGGGVALNMLSFNSAGIGAARSIYGYNGAKEGGSAYYSGATGWEVNAKDWGYGLHATNGIFTCPWAGIYAVGHNGIHRGGSGLPAGFNTYGYSAWSKNGVINYHDHWNQGASTNVQWHSGGHSHLIQCNAGDTLVFWVNHAPGPTSPDAVSQNYGLYPNNHHCVWCRLVG